MAFYGLSDFLATELAKKALGGHCWQELTRYLRTDGSVRWDAAAADVTARETPPGGWSSGEKELLLTVIAIGNADRLGLGDLSGLGSSVGGWPG
jgi:hypothetical protein